MNCRFCNKELVHLFVSLGSTPLSNAYLTKDNLDQKEPVYPLDVFVCDNCFLVQLPEFESPENIFSDYAYFSSYSDSWLKHANKYVGEMIDCFAINKDKYVVEIASNDGYLLQYFLNKGIPVLGIEPATNVAQVARDRGIPTEDVFFGTSTARRLQKEGKSADLLLGNNVLAHVPDLNDFVSGLKILLKPNGIITMEFPHLMSLIDGVQFDTIYHEHFSYFSFLTVDKIFSSHGLSIFDVKKLPTHGGSLRIYAKHKEDGFRKVSEDVLNLKKLEEEKGYLDIKYYLSFQDKVKELKKDILSFLETEKKNNKKIVGYGAAAKGNTLLNYCNINSKVIDYVVDKSPHKQGRFLPGSHIPIKAPDVLRETRPDYVLILPWNIKEEIMDQSEFIKEWGGRFVIPVPNVEVI